MNIRVGSYQRFYDPSLFENEPWYINDHCIIRGKDGWHLFGITSFTGGAYNERYFVHGGGNTLTGEFTEWNKVIDRGTTADGAPKYLIEAETYGDGIKMWLLSQGSWVKVTAPQEFVEEMRTEISKLSGLYEQ